MVSGPRIPARSSRRATCGHRLDARRNRCDQPPPPGRFSTRIGCPSASPIAACSSGGDIDIAARRVRPTMVMGLVGTAARRQSAAASTTARCLRLERFPNRNRSRALRSACSCREPVSTSPEHAGAAGRSCCGPLCCARMYFTASRARADPDVVGLLGDLDHLLEPAMPTAGRTHANDGRIDAAAAPLVAARIVEPVLEYFQHSRAAGLPCPCRAAGRCTPCCWRTRPRCRP